MSKPRKSGKKGDRPIDTDEILARIDEEIAMLRQAARLLLAESGESVDKSKRRKSKRRGSAGGVQYVPAKKANSRFANSRRKGWVAPRPGKFVGILPPEPFPPLEPEKPKSAKARRTSDSAFA